MDHFYTIEKPAIAEFKDRGSKFLAHAYPILSTNEFKKNLQLLKKEHPKAVHHCFAYRLGLSGDVFRVSDDGEPSGTAGKPILGQIDSKHLTDTAIIIVRYFGGTLLGVPGLIHAYKTAASMVLQIVPTIQKQIEVAYILHFEYRDLNDIMLLIKNSNSTILEQQLQLFPYIKINVPKNRLESFIFKLKELHNVIFKLLV